MNYFELGGDKQLNEIVCAGSHDAGITSGGKNVKTQSLDIEGQAQAGVRIFDLRVAATSGAKVDGVKTVELKSFHAPGLKNETKVRNLPGVGTVKLERSKFKSGGDWGLGLTDILDGAKRFVQSDAGKTEFLLLKFDKSTNWTCIEYTNPLHLPEGPPAVGPTRKRYMPNIVMIDFADEAKCRVIRALNDLSPDDLAKL